MRGLRATIAFAAVAVALTGAVVAVAGPNGDPHCAFDGTACQPVQRLIVKERERSEGVPIEGSYRYLIVRQAGDVVFRGRFGGPVHLKRKLRTGAYEVSSYERFCEGNCGQLGPPADRCVKTVSLRPRKDTRVEIVRASGSRCRVHVL